MSRASYLARWIIQAELHLVGIMHPSTIRAFDHSRLFSILFGIHDNVRLPNGIKEAAMLVAFNNILHRNITPSNAGSGRYPNNSARANLTACPIGDMLALLEVAEWGQRPVQVLKLFIESGHVHCFLVSVLAYLLASAIRIAAQIAIGADIATLEKKGCFCLFG